MTEEDMIMSNDNEIRLLGRELFSQHATKYTCKNFIISAYNKDLNPVYILEFYNRFFDIITEGKGYCDGQIADILHDIYLKNHNYY